MDLIAWFCILIVQSAAFTWVGRARNSGSYGYHAIAAISSNGVWFVSQFYLIGMLANKPGMPIAQAAMLGGVYVSGTVIGSVAMHYASVIWLERGKRKVGS